MKKSLPLFIILLILVCCNNPGGRSWIIPVNIDPSDLIYTPAQMESFEMRRNQVIDSLKEGYIILRSTDQASFNRHEFRPNNYFYYLTGYDAPRSYAVLSLEKDHPFMLSLPPQSIRSMIYEGGHQAAEQVKELYRPHKLLTYYEFRQYLDSIVRTGAPVYLDRSDQNFYNEIKR